MAYIDESVVNVALPAIEADLKTSVVVMQWLVNAYTLCLSALLLVGGASGDRFGRRRIFVIGIGIFAAASVWCGFAPDVTQLILARAAQGVGAALLIPCSLAIIGASFDETERGKAIGTWAGFSAISAAIGPLLGGWIVDHFTWRLIFLINPFVALPAIWIVLRHVPESRDPASSPGLDWLGALLAFAGLGSLVFGLVASSDLGWRDSKVVASIVAGLLLLVAFVFAERHSPAPMMPLDLFRSRTFSGVNLLTLLLYAALGGAFFFLPSISSRCTAIRRRWRAPCSSLSRSSWAGCRAGPADCWTVSERGYRWSLGLRSRLSAWRCWHCRPAGGRIGRHSCCRSRSSASAWRWR